MRRPGSGVSQRPGLRHCLDYSLLVGYNVMSLLWRKRTPIPAWGPGVVCYAGSFFVSPAVAFTPSPACFLPKTLPYKPHQEYSITVRGRPPVGTRILLMFLCLGILSTVMACTVAPPSTPPPAVTPPAAVPSAVPPPVTPSPSDLPPAVVPPPSAHPPSTTGNRAPEIYHPSPYEHKMNEEEQQYRRQRGVQERAQEQKYRQWEQERERERDPRYEWMR
jgi:hypothetical protein